MTLRGLSPSMRKPADHDVVAGAGKGAGGDIYYSRRAGRVEVDHIEIRDAGCAVHSATVRSVGTRGERREDRAFRIIRRSLPALLDLRLLRVLPVVV